jgi:hypothetical protein
MELNQDVNYESVVQYTIKIRNKHVSLHAERIIINKLIFVFQYHNQSI